MKRDVFISYSRKNYDTVMEIKRQIDATTGADCWIDLNGIESGSEQFEEDIIGGINDCQVFLFMLSGESQQSEYALLELNFAKKKRKRIVLVNIDNCQLCDKFEFKYGLTDTISWRNAPQREKLLRDVKKWVIEVQTVLGNQIEAQVLKPFVNPLKEIEEHLSRLDREMGELESFKDNDSGKYGFRDDTGRVVIPPQWIYAYFFSEGLSSVENSNSKWGYIDKKGQEMIPCQWTYADSFNNGLALVKDNIGMWWKIDKTGKVVGEA